MNLSSASFESGLGRFLEVESKAAAVSLWKHKRLFGARPSGRPKTAEEEEEEESSVRRLPYTTYAHKGGEWVKKCSKFVDKHNSEV